MVRISNPFPKINPPVPPAIPGLPPRYLPSVGTPPRVTAREQARAEQIPAGIARGDHAPRYGDRPAAKPFPERYPVITDANPAPKAGGGKTK
jgi:hypothetical protein